MVAAFYYRAPRSFAYQWSRDARRVPTRATADHHRPTTEGSYACRVTATNEAGSASQTSKAVNQRASPAQIRAWLLRHITPSGKAARIAAVVKLGGYSYSFSVLTGGQLTIAWYYLPNGASLNRPNHKPKPMLIAIGKRSFSTAGVIKLTVKLTRTGKQMLKRTSSLKLTAKGTYTRTQRAATTAPKTFTVRR